MFSTYNSQSFWIYFATKLSMSKIVHTLHQLHTYKRRSQGIVRQRDRWGRKLTADAAVTGTRFQQMNLMKRHQACLCVGCHLTTCCHQWLAHSHVVHHLGLGMCPRCQKNCMTTKPPLRLTYCPVLYYDPVTLYQRFPTLHYSKTLQNLLSYTIPHLTVHHRRYTTDSGHHNVGWHLTHCLSNDDDQYYLHHLYVTV